MGIAQLFGYFNRTGVRGVFATTGIRGDFADLVPRFVDYVAYEEAYLSCSYEGTRR